MLCRKDASPERRNEGDVDEVAGSGCGGSGLVPEDSEERPERAPRASEADPPSGTSPHDEESEDRATPSLQCSVYEPVDVDFVTVREPKGWYYTMVVVSSEMLARSW